MGKFGTIVSMDYMYGLYSMKGPLHLEKLLVVGVVVVPSVIVFLVVVRCVIAAR